MPPSHRETGRRSSGRVRPAPATPPDLQPKGSTVSPKSLLLTAAVALAVVVAHEKVTSGGGGVRLAH
jgi:hypothetical protein